MKYCDSCHKEFGDDTSFCPSCGNRLASLVKERVEKPISQPIRGIQPKHIVIGVVIVGIIVVILLVRPTATGNIPATPQKESCPFECCINDPKYETRVCQGSNYQCINNKCAKASCPSECCPEGEYSAKACSSGFKCEKNRCVPEDSDNDGLSDLEEIDFGSNPKVFDEDGDGLSAYQEKQKGTNPINPNTDGDRYKDAEDPNPISKNSANVQIQFRSKEVVPNVLGFLEVTKLDLNFKIATIKADVLVNNIGNDYAEYVRYDVVVRLKGTELKRVPPDKPIGRLNTGDSIINHFDFDVRIADVPNVLLNIAKDSELWEVEIQNVDFEKYV